MTVTRALTNNHTRHHIAGEQPDSHRERQIKPAPHLERVGNMPRAALATRSA